MRRVCSLMLGLMLVLGCGGEPAVAPGVIVTMEGRELQYEEFARYVSNTVGESEAAMASDVLSGLFDQYLDEILLRRWAVEEGVAAAEPETDALLALLSQLPSEEPTSSEALEYFEGHRAEFRLPERVRLRQILVDDVDEARQALAELRRGSDFAAVADRYARHAFTPPGGDQGLLARQDLPPAFEEIVWGMGAGEMSDIIATDYGFYIFEVAERLPAREVSLEEARSGIVRVLRRQAADAELARLVEAARSRYNVGVHRENLPFDYDGHYLSDRLPDEGLHDADD